MNGEKDMAGLRLSSRDPVKCAGVFVSHKEAAV